MGTRSLTFVHEDDGQPLVCIYQQYDGYFSGVGDRLLSFLKDSEIVNGIGMDTGITQFNGAGDLAARLITFLKSGDADDAGNVYIMAPTMEADQCGAEFVYHIYATVGKEPRLQAGCVYGGPTVYGPASEIVWPSDDVADDIDDRPILDEQRRALFAMFFRVFETTDSLARFVFTRLVLGKDGMVSWSPVSPHAITVDEASRLLRALDAIEQTQNA